MMLSGNLSDWSVGDLLQMLHITKKTASLHVEGTDRSGVVHFDEGSIVNAEVSLGGGAKGDPRDEVVEAVYVLELLGEGTFEIKNEVPPRMVEPLAVAEALELAGKHLTAERHLDETGLLAARGLRLAQTIEEPIILSEQVWNAISGSIPAFTFPELEQRLGRAAAVSTVEQFRDLGILEAVLEEVEPTPPPTFEQTPTIEHEIGDLVEDFAETDDSEPAGSLVDSWTPPIPEPGDEAWTQPAGEPDTSWLAPSLEADVGLVAGHDLAAEPALDDEGIVPIDVEEVRPIISDAPDASIVVPDEPVEPEASEEESAEPVSSGLTPGASSLSAAIRAAAGVSAAGSSDDEASLLSEAANAGHPEADGAVEGDDGSPRRTVDSLVSPSSGSSGGGLGGLSARVRQAAGIEQED